MCRSVILDMDEYPEFYRDEYRSLFLDEVLEDQTVVMDKTGQERGVSVDFDTVREQLAAVEQTGFRCTVQGGMPSVSQPRSDSSPIFMR